jgi:hypothetical protein
MPDTTRIDRSALRTNQFIVVVLLVSAFVFAFPFLVALVAFVLLAGAAARRPGFGFVYARLVRPLGWLPPDPAEEGSAPHTFAQALGGAFLALAGGAFLARWNLAGWVLTWLVIALAVLNLASGICVGCLVHYRLARLGVPGFVPTAGAEEAGGRT